MKKHQTVLLGYEHTYYRFQAAIERAQLIGLHGFGNSGRSFRHFEKEMQERGLSLAAPDLLGFGQTAKPHAGYSLTQYARLTEAFVQELGLVKPVLIGHSFGGLLALATTLLLPDVFSGLILMSPGGFHPLQSFQRLADRNWAYRLMRSPLFAQVVQSTSLRMVFDQPVTMDALLRMHRSHQHLDLDQTGLRPQLQDIPIPMLLLWGDRDNILPPFVQKRARRQLPQAQFQLIRQAGHAPMRDAPSAVADAIASFLEQHHLIRPQNLS